jgi:hypothetical protein
MRFCPRFFVIKKKPLKEIGMKKFKLDKLLNMVRDYISSNSAKGFVFKEDIAKALKVKVHYVEQCLHKLNLEGVVEKPIHKRHHDPGYWCKDVYYLTVK